VSKPNQPDTGISGPEDSSETRRKLTSASTWVDRGSAASPAAGFGRRLATVATVESADDSSTYSFSTTIGCTLGADGETITVREYAGRGIYVDGPDLGTISYRNTAEWQGRLNPDRTFEVKGVISWNDRFNQGALLNVTFRATLIDGEQLAFVSNTTEGEAVTGPAAATAVVVDVPACW
jgi:hypothetical protein